MERGGMGVDVIMAARLETDDGIMPRRERGSM